MSLASYGYGDEASVASYGYGAWHPPLTPVWVFPLSGAYNVQPQLYEYTWLIAPLENEYAWTIQPQLSDYTFLVQVEAIMYDIHLQSRDYDWSILLAKRDYEWEVRLLPYDYDYAVEVTIEMSTKITSLKDPLDEIFLVFDLSKILEAGETVTGTPTVTATVDFYEDVEDPTPSNIISGAIANTDTTITQKIIGGVANNHYHVEVYFETTDGRKLSAAAIIPCKER